MAKNRFKRSNNLISFFGDLAASETTSIKCYIRDTDDAEECPNETVIPHSIASPNNKMLEYQQVRSFKILYPFCKVKSRRLLLIMQNNL